ncbi:MAG: hypothetical protein GY845_20660 [Planctomycetes bacterium]|nr:hypothetical protein [Planctomycetota bacterium]
MQEEPSDLNFENLKQLIAEWVYIEGDPPDRENFQDKLAILERAIECLRIKYKCIENPLPLEIFIQGYFRVDRNILHYYFPTKHDSLGSGTPPLQLQPMLLLFLLIYHKQSYRIYDIISGFIHKIWDQLEFLDFKKTQTGVVRCFTNTRFAANTLRDYGLLKFTPKEAYRTWVLSLPGFLVASKVLKEWNGIWDLPTVGKEKHFDLYPSIFTAWIDLRTYDAMVERLAYICEPNTQVFKTFENVLKAAYGLLGSYWKVIQDGTKSIKERKKISMEHIQKLDDMPEIEQFYTEFSKCINVDRLLSGLDTPPSLL